MPGAYAHITLVNELREPARLERIDGFIPKACAALMDYFKFCELGAVSPDYPYLGIGNRGAAQWADRMHYEHTGDMIKTGVSALASWRDDAARRKAFAWLLGYAAHVATDVTIHPVVELKVGPYAKNKTKHRICELHQDAHIFQRLNLGGVGLAEHLDSGIWGCCDKPGSGRIDRIIGGLWKTMLKTCYPTAFRSSPPDIDAWHRGFRFVVDKVEDGGSLFPFARHLAVNSGMTYPNSDEVDPQYVEYVDVPDPVDGLPYDEIFNRAIGNVEWTWSLIARGIYGNDGSYMTALSNWNLDTGRDETGRLVFWSHA